MTEDRRNQGARIQVELDVDLATYGPYALSKLENVSIGGAFIKSQKLYPVGTEVKLRFKLPGDDKIIEAEGEVVWTYEQRGQSLANHSGVGVRFTQILQSDRDRIKTFIRQIVGPSQE